LGARRIAVLEDDPVSATIYRVALGRAGYACEIESTVAGFLARYEALPCDLQLLDWALPDGTAADVIRWARARHGWSLPIIVASLHSEEDKVVDALALGADDYIFKPVRVQELLARIAAHLRKGSPAGGEVLDLAPHRLHPAERLLTLEGRPVELTPKEFELLWCLCRNKGRLVSRQRLLEEVWGVAADLDTRTVDAHVSRLRRKLGWTDGSPWMIAAGYGHGYRLARRDG
jgi:DNA-binding response OmpR family regulator